MAPTTPPRGAWRPLLRRGAGQSMRSIGAMGKARLWMENLQETRFFFQIWGSKSTFSNKFLSNSWIQKRHSRHLEGHVNSDSYTPEGDGKSTVGWQSQAYKTSQRDRNDRIIVSSYNRHSFLRAHLFTSIGINPCTFHINRE